jgi:hypothetical protein
VSNLLYECGEELVREGGGAGIGGAAELFALAGRYVELLRLLNRELASRLVDTEQGDEGRRFWKNAALSFHQSHLSHGRTHVIEVLEAEDSRAVGDTFECVPAKRAREAGRWVLAEADSSYLKRLFSP